MQAIVTAFVNDDRQRPAIRAAWASKHLTMAYDETLSLDDNHMEAAARLARTLGWAYDFVTGRLSGGDYCHVRVTDTRYFTTQAAPSVKSPPETWRGRGGGGSLMAPRRGTKAPS